MKKDKSGFRAPEGYFDGFEQRLQERMRTPGKNLPSGDGFRVPEGYFNAFESRLQERMDAAEAKPVIPLERRRPIYFAAAAMAAILLCLALILTTNTEELQFEDLAHAEIEAYFLQQEIEMTDQELAEYLPIDELQLDALAGTPLRQDQILDYLDENTDDYEDLNISYDED